MRDSATLTERSEMRNVAIDRNGKQPVQKCLHMVPAGEQWRFDDMWGARQKRSFADPVCRITRAANIFEVYPASCNSQRKLGLVNDTYLDLQFPQPFRIVFRRPVFQRNHRAVGNLHQFHLSFNSFQTTNSGDYAAQANKDKRNGGDSGHACEQERPSLNVRCAIFGGLCLFGLGWGLSMALRIDNERDFRRAALSLLGAVVFGLGMSFWFFTFLHPHTWGLPPQWLPEKWNPCPADYRDYFPHGQNVSQKLLDARAFLYYDKYMANVLPIEKQVTIIGSLCEGSSIRAIERMTGVHRDTVMRLGVRVGQGCTAMMSDTLCDLNTTRLEMDEIWGFIGKKEKHVRPVDDPTKGDVWTFCAIDADTKLVPTFKVGKRTNATAEAFVQDVASRMRNRVQISTDGLKAYVDAIEHSFGGDVDYAQIIKTYGHEEVSNNRRYSAPEFVSSEKRPVFGNPDVDLISTSYVERLNATTRLHMRRLTRLTLAFSKKLENFEAAVGLHFAYYNFVKRHNTLRATPAQAAGVTGTQWTVAQLLKAAV